MSPIHGGMTAIAEAPGIPSYRASSMPLLFACRPSLDGDLRVGLRFEATDLGSATHQAMVGIVTGNELDLDTLARRWSVDRDELGVLVWFGRKAWEKLAPSFPEDEEHILVLEKQSAVLYQPEDGADPFMLTGGVDLGCWGSDGVDRILDWKGGRLDHDYYHQMATYAVIRMLSDPHVREVRATVVWLRDQDVENFVFTRADIPLWIGRLRARLAEKGEFKLGTHCDYCPRAHNCPAIQAAARQGVAMFSGENWVEADESQIADRLRALDPAARAALYRKSQQLVKFAEVFRHAFRITLREDGGVLDCGDGTLLKLVEEKGQRHVDVEKAWPVLVQTFGGTVPFAALDIRLGAAEDLVKEAAPKRGGAAAIRKLKEDLATADAVTQGYVTKIRAVRKVQT